MALSVLRGSYSTSGIPVAFSYLLLVLAKAALDPK
jgi:hypothetical protein